MGRKDLRKKTPKKLAMEMLTQGKEITFNGMPRGSYLRLYKSSPQGSGVKISGPTVFRCSVHKGEKTFAVVTVGSGWDSIKGIREYEGKSLSDQIKDLEASKEKAKEEEAKLAAELEKIEAEEEAAGE